jgi:Predicted acetyltransferase
MILRKATIDDIELLINLRIDYIIEDIGELSQEEAVSIKKQLKTYFAKHIPTNTFIGIFAEIDNSVVSTAYLAISENPANLAFSTGIKGTLLNVLTYPEYRRKGIATKVINKVIEEAKAVGVSHINLSATSDGKYLYEKMGFKESSYTAMGLRLI